MDEKDRAENEDGRDGDGQDGILPVIASIHGVFVGFRLRPETGGFRVERLLPGEAPWGER